MKKKSIYTIAECAIFIAMAIALSYLKIRVGANGGSIDFVMVPLLILAYRNGVKYGIASGMVFGLLHCLLDGGIGWGLPSILVDYVLAYGVIGIAGLFKGKRKFIEISSLIACLARYAVHFISGVTLFAITTATEVGGIVTSNIMLYSLVYNALYMVPSTIAAVVIMSLLRVPLKKLERMPGNV